MVCSKHLAQYYACCAAQLPPMRRAVPLTLHFISSTFRINAPHPCRHFFPHFSPPNPAVWFSLTWTATLDPTPLSQRSSNTSCHERGTLNPSFPLPQRSPTTSCLHCCGTLNPFLFHQHSPATSCPGTCLKHETPSPLPPPQGSHHVVWQPHSLSVSSTLANASCLAAWNPRLLPLPPKATKHDTP